MFEGSLVESRGLAVSATQRWTAVGSIVFQFGIAGLLVAIPLLHPQALPMLVDAPRLALPVPPPPPPPVPVQAQAADSASAMSVAAVRPAVVEHVQGSLTRPLGVDQGPGPMVTEIRMGSAIPGGAVVGIGPGGPSVSVVRAATTGTVRLSSGVSSGMLLTPIQPVYPAIAKAAGVQGTVVMEAVISKAGRIESLRALSGPQMLRGAALEAVQAARYQPYRLNGEPTEVQTTITVVFRLGS
jgi:protein TonB